MAYLLKPSTFDKLEQLINRSKGERVAPPAVVHSPSLEHRLGGVEWSCSLLPDGKTVQVLVGQIVWGPFAIRNGTRNGQELPPYYFETVDISSVGENGKWIYIAITIGTDPIITQEAQTGTYYVTFTSGAPLMLSEDENKPAHDVVEGIIRIPLSLWRMRDADPEKGYYRAERLLVAHVGRLDLTSFFLPPVGQGTT